MTLNFNPIQEFLFFHFRCTLVLAGTQLLGLGLSARLYFRSALRVKMGFLVTYFVESTGRPSIVFTNPFDPVIVMRN